MDGLFIICMDHYRCGIITASDMRIRNVAFCALMLTALSGCATVSMVPGSAVVETEITAEQTQLRDVCDAYVTRATNENWITPSGGLLGLAKVLINGSSDDSAPISYDEYIEAETGDTAQLYVRIAADITSAMNGLEVVTSQAQISIAAGPASKSSLRRDIVSYERALVAAQKSRRSFSKAISIVAERSDAQVETAEAALATLDAAIDVARETADQLADAKITSNDEVATS